ncbi:GNAT family N-acetyltransferase [Paenibacillus eucommiae]|uniref:GNAT superfamily N-acetyltransferase n=1 Tax=Paenibacillus eucommiae TaxID=1355755 RepID=A0ABS4J4U3_9BACL|nr:GNAT family N-acetyltransferase [Paenibacillus eucommiae]MBP1994852.1 GNAT superfamily N-acetyltransferase [Paenibacillus eucommiae]
MAQVVIRHAVEEDVIQLRQLMITYIVVFYRYRQPEEEKLDEMIRILLEHKEGVQFVAELEGKLVGFATLFFRYSSFHAAKIAVMNDLFVAEDQRRQGIAHKLFAACKGYSARHRYVSMIWSTGKDNISSQRFYEKLSGEQSEWLTYSINPTIGIGD